MRRQWKPKQAAQAAPTGGTIASDVLSEGVPTAFYLGWTMAGLANQTTTDHEMGHLDRVLPTEHELPPQARRPVSRPSGSSI